MTFSASRSDEASRAASRTSQALERGMDVESGRATAGGITGERGGVSWMIPPYNLI